MPGMNVRGDQHLNFTPAEAADWLDGAEVRQYAPRHAHPADNDNTIAGVFGVVALGVILTIIGVGFFGSNLLRQRSRMHPGLSFNRTILSIRRRHRHTYLDRKLFQRTFRRRQRHWNIFRRRRLPLRNIALRP